jgi:hypothetical protein
MDGIDESKDVVGRAMEEREERDVTVTVTRDVLLHNFYLS